MNVTAATSQPAATPIEKLADASHLSKEAKITEATYQFEAMFVRKILSDAMKPTLKTKGAQSSSTDALYQDVSISSMAEKISRAGHLGIAKTLQAALAPPGIKPKAAELTSSITRP